MSKNPLNLILRFCLELAALFAMGFWGFSQHEDTFAKLLFGIGLPLAFAAAWGTFRVDDDPKKAPVRVPGVVRLLLEIVFFGVAVALLYAASHSIGALILGVLVVFHYLISFDRILWLLRER